MTYRTTAAYISGAIVGNMWMPDCVAGLTFHGDIRRQIDRFSDSSGATFRDVLLHMLMERGGDFQNPRFAADTVVRIERRAVTGLGKYTVHVREREVSTLRDCADLVNADVYTFDVMGAE